MNDFILPCGLLIFVFFTAFSFCSWHVKRRYIIPLERRVRRLKGGSMNFDDFIIQASEWAKRPFAEHIDSV